MSSIDVGARRGYGAATALAVVVGSGLNALGVLRSLARGDVPTIVLGPTEGCAMRSRHGRKVGLAQTDGGALYAALMAIASSEGNRPVLFLTEERSVVTVSARRSALETAFRFRLPPPPVVESLLDKTSFQAECLRLGARIPRGIAVRSMPDLDALAGLRLPCVLKPAWKNYAYGQHFSKAYVVNGESEARGLYEQIAPIMPDMIVQEWIDGDDSDIYFCLQYLGRGGILVASFVGRKVRSWPPKIGGTASCMPAPDFATQLSQTTTEFFTNVGVEGMASMEYKRDRRDGQFYMVEPTIGRTDFQEEVATVNGVNIPLAAYLHEIEGAQPPMAPVVPPRLWREPVIDRWAREMQRVASVAALGNHRKVNAYFRVDDPGPWLDNVGERVGGKLLGVLRRRGRPRA